MRVVSLLSSATEAMDKMGLLDRIVGVSEYCDRYVQTDAPVVGQYLNCDIEQIKALKPDLVILTTGIQRKLGMKLAAAGLPVYALNLPQSFYGILENQRILGGLLDEMQLANDLNAKMLDQRAELKLHHPAEKPRVYVELWLGKHERAVGGLSFISDLVEMAGGISIYADRAEAYMRTDYDEIAALNPDVYICFYEPEYVVDGCELSRQRGWSPEIKVIHSIVDCGQNVIQEGPSLLDTAKWLQKQLLA